MCKKKRKERTFHWLLNRKIWPAAFKWTGRHPSGFPRTSSSSWWSLHHLSVSLSLQNSSWLFEWGSVFLLPGIHVLLSLPAVEMVGEVGRWRQFHLTEYKAVQYWPATATGGWWSSKTCLFCCMGGCNVTYGLVYSLLRVSKLVN